MAKPTERQKAAFSSRITGEVDKLVAEIKGRIGSDDPLASRLVDAIERFEEEVFQVLSE